RCGRLLPRVRGDLRGDLRGALAGDAVGFGVLGLQPRVFGLLGRQTLGLQALRFQALGLDPLRFQDPGLELHRRGQGRLQLLGFDTLRFGPLRLETLCLETLCLETLCLETLCLEALRLEALRLETLRLETLCLHTRCLETFCLEALRLETLFLTGSFDPRRVFLHDRYVAGTGLDAESGHVDVDDRRRFDDCLGGRIVVPATGLQGGRAYRRQAVAQGFHALGQAREQRHAGLVGFE